MPGAHAYATRVDVPMGNNSHDSSGGEATIDGALGGASTEPAVDIAGTQSGRPATVDIDDEGGTRCSDAILRAGRGKRAVGEEGGGRGGQSKGKVRVWGPDWTDKERMALVRLLFEEDCAQQSRRRRQKIRGRREKYDWIIGKMVEQGFPKRDMEDCEAKFYALLDKAKKIRDYSGESGKPSYWHMLKALQWKLGKADGSCEDMMHSVNLQRGQTSTVTDDEDTGGSSENGGNRRKADSDSAEGAKSRRTGGGSGHSRRSVPESSADASRGGSFADIAHALVNANDRHADKIAGSFAHAMDGMNKTMADGNNTLLQRFAMLSAHTRGGKMSSSPMHGIGEVVDMAGDFALTHRRRIEQTHELARKWGVLFTRVSSMVEDLQRLQGEVEKANVKEGLAGSRAEAAEQAVASLREEVARLQHQFSLYEGGSNYTPVEPDSFVTTVQSPGCRRGGTVASVTVSVGHMRRDSTQRTPLRRRVPADARSPSSLPVEEKYVYRGRFPLVIRHCNSVM
ncbi:hypothetical protein CBR_g39870 [Chara braunii]|uniref:Myb/SANT-like DNA-binding domain-containing protein n=1 Tax=Chara braunii TaxID=69332 RepID=A0A388LSW4_CHABU|nr:hypothetical protein CBR_g39870 [Chara braunii]|eukprot:GBG85302.1 hypothetical protein CBR_g39870 [Chara braunii]